MLLIKASTTTPSTKWAVVASFAPPPLKVTCLSHCRDSVGSTEPRHTFSGPSIPEDSRVSNLRSKYRMAFTNGPHSPSAVDTHHQQWTMSCLITIHGVPMKGLWEWLYACMPCLWQVVG